MDNFFKISSYLCGISNYVYYICSLFIHSLNYLAMKTKTENQTYFVILRGDNRYLGNAGWVTDIYRAFHFSLKADAEREAKGYLNVSIVTDK